MPKDDLLIKAGRISPKELEELKARCKKGGRVIAGNVEHIRPGESGTIGEVKDNGNILVFWNNGIVNDVRYLEDEVYLVAESGCILGRSTAFREGHCEGRQRCETCGWNYEIAEKRKMMIQMGEMKKDKNGVKKLVIGESGY